jgi:hypothetical protein
MSTNYSRATACDTRDVLYAPQRHFHHWPDHANQEGG